MGERLIIASASPTRTRLLAAAGVKVEVEPPLVDEGAIKRAFQGAAGVAADCALALAEAKARQVAENHRHALVVGADQILVCGNMWFDKPASLDEARVQLQALQGRAHQLVSAACVVRDEDRLWHVVSSPTLTMRRFSEAFLDAYLDAEGTEILGSVGAYRIEGRGIQLVADIEGDYFAVLGLPLLELLCFLRSRGALPS